MIFIINGLDTWGKLFSVTLIILCDNSMLQHTVVHRRAWKFNRYSPWYECLWRLCQSGLQGREIPKDHQKCMRCCPPKMACPVAPARKRVVVFIERQGCALRKAVSVFEQLPLHCVCLSHETVLSQPAERKEGLVHPDWPAPITAKLHTVAVCRIRVSMACSLFILV